MISGGGGGEGGNQEDKNDIQYHTVSSLILMSTTVREGSYDIGGGGIRKTKTIFHIIR